MLSIAKIAEVQSSLSKYRLGVKPTSQQIENVCKAALSVQDAVTRIVANSFIDEGIASSQKAYAIAKIFGDGTPSKN